MTNKANYTSTSVRNRGLIAGGAAALMLAAGVATAAPALASTPATTATSVSAQAAAADPVLLVRGDRGANVRAWQLNLDLFGVDVGPIDGVFGATTEAATRTLQEQFGRTADGVVSRDDITALASLYVFDGRIENPRIPVDSPVRLSVGSTGEGVSAWQADLMGVQNNMVVLDGRFGDDVRDATIAFQRDRGITADGVVGPDTRREMAAVLGIS